MHLQYDMWVHLHTIAHCSEQIRIMARECEPKIHGLRDDSAKVTPGHEYAITI